MALKALEASAMLCAVIGIAVSVSKTSSKTHCNKNIVLDDQNPNFIHKGAPTEDSVELAPDEKVQSGQVRFKYDPCRGLGLEALNLLATLQVGIEVSKMAPCFGDQTRLYCFIDLAVELCFSRHCAPDDLPLPNRCLSKRRTHVLRSIFYDRLKGNRHEYWDSQVF